MSGLGGNETAMADGVVSDQTCAPWRLLLVPFLSFGYILVRACLNFVTCNYTAVLRDLREVCKALAGVGVMMGSTLLILYLISVQTHNSQKSKIDEIHDLEFGFMSAISLLTVFTSVRSWQNHHRNTEMLGEDGWVPANVYMDLGDRSMVTAITCFFGQNILFIYLMGGIWSGADKFHESSSMTLVKILVKLHHFPSFTDFRDSIVFLVTSAFVQNLIWGQMGSSFEDNMPYWKSFWKEFRTQNIEIFDTEIEKGKKKKSCWSCLDEAEDEDAVDPQCKDDVIETKVSEHGVEVYDEPLMGDWIYLRSEVTFHELIVRAAMSWWVNGAMRKLVVMLVPLMLITVDSYLDFVQNATALTFIVQLDDLASGRRFRMHKRKHSSSMGESPSMKSALLS